MLVTINDIKNKKYLPLNSGEADGWNVVEYKNHRNTPPEIKFQWCRKFFVSLSEEDMKWIRKEFSDIEVSNDRDKINYYYCWASSAASDGESILVFRKSISNIDRNTWGVVSSNEGRRDFSSVAYGTDLSQDGGITTSSTTEVIRDSLIRFIAVVDIPPKIKYHYAIKPLWDRLLKDAIDNQITSVQKCVGNNHGFSGRIMINNIIYK